MGRVTNATKVIHSVTSAALHWKDAKAAVHVWQKQAITRRHIDKREIYDQYYNVRR